jgi:lysozyme
MTYQTKKTRTVPAVTFAAVIALAMPFVASKEGLRLDPYYDTVGVLTVCYGETNVPMRRYSKAECDAQFKKSLETRYGRVVAEVTPGIFDYPRSAVAAISFAYNIGPQGYTKSRTAALFNQGKFKEGCQAMMGWLRPPEIKGRRTKERDLCLSGLKNVN